MTNEKRCMVSEQDARQIALLLRRAARALQGDCATYTVEGDKALAADCDKLAMLARGYAVRFSGLFARD